MMYNGVELKAIRESKGLTCQQVSDKLKSVNINLLPDSVGGAESIRAQRPRLLTLHWLAWAYECDLLLKVDSNGVVVINSLSPLAPRHSLAPATCISHEGFVVKKYRQQRLGVTQAELAAFIGYELRAVSALEGHQRSTSFNVMQAFAIAFQIELLVRITTAGLVRIATIESMTHE